MKRGSLRLALTFLAKDLNALTCNQDLTEKGNQNVRETTEERRRSQPSPQPQQSCSDSNSDQVSTKKPLLVIERDSLIKNV